MEFGPLGDEVYRRTYSRTKTDGTQERWPETVDRVVAGNANLVGLLGVTELDADLAERIADMRIIPAGRHLWASGSDSGLGLFNCHRAGWGTELADHFTFVFDQLMLGGGVGANYSDNYLEDMPEIKHEVAVAFQDSRSTLPDELVMNDNVFVVEDSREGWVSALEHLIDSSGRQDLDDEVVYIMFDTSNVRPSGALIKGFGGVASGPGPLTEMLEAVAKTLLDSLRSGGKLSPLGAMSIDHEIAACVVSGNVRRSARMSILHWKSDSIFDFINCKSDASKHWSTNISVEVDDDFWTAVDNEEEHAVSVLDKISTGMLRNGEPGFYNSSLASVGEVGDVRCTNPCGEITLEDWEQCCLGHVNLAHPKHSDHEELQKSFEIMARFLVRATIAPSSHEGQQNIKDNNRRIGVGFFGFQEWLASNGLMYSEAIDSAEVYYALQSWKSAVKEAANAEADRLGVNHPIKYTTVAPTGTIAKLPGTTEGMHPVYAKFFMRRVRYAENSPDLARLKEEGYPTEPCIYTARTEVVSFFVEDSAVEKYGEIIESVDEIDLEVLLRTQALVQNRYADNAVSFTANVLPGEDTPESLAELLKSVGPELKGSTIFPDLSRPQSPMERLTKEEYEAATFREIGQSIDDACATGACPVR